MSERIPAWTSGWEQKAKGIWLLEKLIIIFLEFRKKSYKFGLF